MRRLLDWQAEFPGTPDIRGRMVFDVAGQPIGPVEAVFLDTGSQGKVRFLRVAARLIPVDALREASEAGLTIGHGTEQVRASPSVGELDTLPESAVVSVYAHYGYTPHWEAENTFPGYPAS